MIVHILLHANTVAPLPPTDAGDAVVRSTAVAMISNVVGQYVVPGIGQVLVLNDKVDLDTVVAAPRLAKVSREAGATHGQSMVEDDKPIALTALGRDIPGLERSAVI